MNEPQYSYTDTGEKIIDLRSLFFFLLKRWRSLLIFLAIGFLVGFLYGTWQKTRTLYDPDDPKNAKDQPLLEEIERAYRQRGLKAEERSREYRAYLDRKTQYTYAIVRYFVDADNDKVTTALGTLLNVTKEDGYLDDLWEILDPASLPGVKAGKEITRSSVGVVLNQSFASSGDPESVALYTGSYPPTSLVYGVITYTIHYVTEAQREAIIDYVHESMMEMKADAAEIYGDFRLERFSVFRDVEQASTTFARMNEIEAANYSDTAEFYDWLQAQASSKNGEYNYASVVKYFKETVLGEERQVSRMKYAALAAFVGAIVWGIWGIVRFFTGGKVRSVSEITSRFGLPSLGCVEAGQKKKFLPDRLIRKWENIAGCSEEYAAASAALLPYRLLLCETGGTKTTPLGIRIAGAANALGSGDLSKDAELLRVAENAENPGAVLLVGLDDSRIDKAEEAVNICRLHRIPVIGVLFRKEG